MKWPKPFNPWTFARRYGIEVYDDWEDLHGTEGLAVEVADGGGFYIAISKTLPKPKKITGLAHELGHVVLGHPVTFGPLRCRNSLQWILHRQYERQAERWAFDRLIGQPLLDAYLEANSVIDVSDFMEIAERMGDLPWEWVMDRAANLHKLELMKAANFWRAENADIDATWWWDAAKRAAAWEP